MYIFLNERNMFHKKTICVPYSLARACSYPWKASETRSILKMAAAGSPLLERRIHYVQSDAYSRCLMNSSSALAGGQAARRVLAAAHYYAVRLSLHWKLYHAVETRH